MSHPRLVFTSSTICEYGHYCDPRDISISPTKNITTIMYMNNEYITYKKLITVRPPALEVIHVGEVIG